MTSVDQYVAKGSNHTHQIGVEQEDTMRLSLAQFHVEGMNTINVLHVGCAAILRVHGVRISHGQSQWAGTFAQPKDVRVSGDGVVNRQELIRELGGEREDCHFDEPPNIQRIQRVWHCQIDALR